jgi:hypothetical protein
MRNVANRRSLLRTQTALLCTLLAGFACSAESGSADSLGRSAEAVQPPISVDPRMSLAITEQPILQNFSLQRVLTQIATSSGVSGLSALALFQDLWNTQNPGPGTGKHCDDISIAGVPSINGYPYTCRPAPAEGAQANCDPFTDPDSSCGYIPIGLFMRFDLAPENGANCGEYRIVYGKNSGRTSGTDRNLIIFEANLPNPHAIIGIRGCEKFVSAFADLSNQPNLAARRDQLETLYFSGYKEFAPVIQFQNFGDNADGVGQVRTNQFVQPNTPRIWSLREFKLRKECSGAACVAHFVPVTAKVNPFGPLFDPAATAPNAAAFQADFQGRVAGLAAATLDGISMNMNDAFNSAQSQENGTTESNYPANFGTAPNAFRSSIQGTLTSLGSSLSPDDVVARAQTMSCAGCHRLSNNAPLGAGLTWPASLGFTHVSEKDVDLEVVGGVTRYLISSALTSSLLPHRKQVVDDYLNNVPHPAKPPTDPIGGRFTD